MSTSSFFSPTNYEERPAFTPSNYKCTKCSTSDCKLWREYQTCLSATSLLCAQCALVDQKKKGPVDDQGRRPSDPNGLYPDTYKTDTIGWYVPCIPTEDGNGCWGYTTVPENAISWWRSL